MKLSDSNRKLKTSNAKIGNQKKYNTKDLTIFDRTGDDKSSLLINDNSTWIDNGTKGCDYNSYFLCFMYN
jgi:hypothetical protein